MISSKTEENAELEELKAIFEKIKKNITRFSNDDSSTIKDSEVIANNDLIMECMAMVDRAALFSKNEEMEGMSTGCIEFLLLDYYLGKSHLQVKDQTVRKLRLMDGQAYFERYLTTCSRLGILGDVDFDLEDLDEEVVVAMSSASKRERKISNYKKEKVTKERIQYLETIIARSGEDKDYEEELRELRTMQLKVHALECINELDMIEMEMMMQNFKEMEGRNATSSQQSNTGTSGNKSGHPQAGGGNGISILKYSKDINGQIVESRDVIKSSVFKVEQLTSVEEYGDEVLRQYHEAEAARNNIKSCGLW